jgi:DNA repair exonuclease SbcCD nuclease subunit
MIRFFTDPHIGVIRGSHTTIASRQRLTEAVFNSTLKAIDGPHRNICLGDLYDTTSNDEKAILQGFAITQKCDKVLAGNHDLPNREGKLSSLQLLSLIAPEGRVILGSVSEPGFDVSVYEDEGVAVFFVPHMATQELFDQSLAEVADFKTREYQGKSILCLHCNYNSGFIQNDASLNLSEAQAVDLLKVFDYILLGHEHVSRELHKGRLIILGNTHPTSFSDVSKKYVWDFDGNEFSKTCIWDDSFHYRSLTINDLDSPLPETIQFVEVRGEAQMEQLPEVAQKVARLWKDYPSLFMVRNGLECISDLPEVVSPSHGSLDLPSRISSALADTDLLPVWNSYLEEVK